MSIDRVYFNKWPIYTNDSSWNAIFETNMGMKGSLNIIPGVQGAMARSTSRDGKCRKRDGAFSTNRRLEKP